MNLFWYVSFFWRDLQAVVRDLFWSQSQHFLVTDWFDEAEANLDPLLIVTRRSPDTPAVKHVLLEFLKSHPSILNPVSK